MSEYVIVTDSCVDMDGDFARELELQVIPLRFTMNGQTFENDLDGKSISIQEMYARLRNQETATTSAANVTDFTTCLEPILAGGRDALVLCFSSGLSSTCSAAFSAVEELRGKYPERKLYAVDTLSASLGEGLLVYHAVKRKQAGESIEAVRDWVEENKLRLCHEFTVEDLFFLKRGGRVSAATAIVGSMLSIKPVLHVDDEGHLIKVGTARGRKASIKALVDRMESNAVNPAGQTVFICHGDCPEEAEYLAGLVKERMGVQEIYINAIGPVIGAHAGPGTLAVFYLGVKR